MECGECTLCCELFPIKELKKPALKLCTFICEKGCSIHGDHPAECKDFNCMYVQVKNIPLELRPDKCHVIFEKHSDTFIVATLDAKFKMTPIAERQVKSFGDQGYRIRLGASDFRKPITWQPTEQI